MIVRKLIVNYSITIMEFLKQSYFLQNFKFHRVLPLVDFSTLFMVHRFRAQIIIVNDTDSYFIQIILLVKILKINTINHIFTMHSIKCLLVLN